MEKPKNTINLDKHLQDFLYHEFKTDDNGAFIMTKRSDICLYIDSMWVVSDRPVKAIVRENPVTIILPLSDINHRILREHFIYVPSWKEFQIQHNHPSGNPYPSSCDDKITQKIKEEAKFLDMQLTDHIVVCDSVYYNFADKGKC